ncbi:MAG: hypothetical protein OXE97_11575 [Gammaproteobacteria bacterium]|nr:hypothetical protein [Gammaproteobacteria bacterium]MCY4281923.1 hypothetical protein [Gammaproteobacteria bacterium]
MKDKTTVVKNDVAEELTEEEAKEIAGGRSEPPSGQVHSNSTLGSNHAYYSTDAPDRPSR